MELIKGPVVLSQDKAFVKRLEPGFRLARVTKSFLQALIKMGDVINGQCRR